MYQEAMEHFSNSLYLQGFLGGFFVCVTYLARFYAVYFLLPKFYNLAVCFAKWLYQRFKNRH